MNTFFKLNSRLKFLFVFLFVFSFFSIINFSKAEAATYYVSSSGSDANNGTSSSTPWQTLSKVNSSTFSPGDNILFKKGDTFYGSITVYQSGTAGNPITFSSYGTGNQPVITGFTNVTSWTNLGNNIWESTNTVSTLSTLNMVSVNNTNTGMGRTPNTGYYNYQSHSGSTSITSSNLTGTPNWTGAELAFNNSDWTVKRRPITAQSGGTLTFTSDLDDTYMQKDNQHFIIQNDIRTLDVQNEWYYNPSTKKISIYSTSQPSNVKVATIETLFTNTARNYITIDGLSFIGSNGDNIVFNSASYFTIRNCSINYSGLEGIFSGWSYSSNLTVENCAIDNSNNNGIGTTEWLTNNTIRSNTVTNSGMIYGANAIRPGSPARNGGIIAHGIAVTGAGSLIEDNIVDNSGYIGIRFYGDNTIVQRNKVSNFCMTLFDGGGIYTWNGSNPSHSGTKVLNNILLSNISNGASSDADAPLISGIYLDDYSNGIEVADNTISGAEYGIFLHEAHHVLVQRNIVFDTDRGIRIYGRESPFYMSNITIQNNKFISKSAGQISMHLDPVELIKPTFVANNNYYARPINDSTNIVAYIRTPSFSSFSKTVAEWKTWSGQDTNSNGSPASISSVSDLLFDYNYSSSPKTISLNQPMVDITGTKYATLMNIPAYSSVVLMPDPNPGTSPSETTPPSISSFSIPTTSTTLAVSPITLTATDTTGVTGYLLSESSTTPSPSSGPWSSTAPTTYTFSSQGTKTLYAFAKDAAGNVSVSSNDSVTITLPTLNPEYSTYSFEESSGITVFDTSSTRNGTIINTGVRTSGKSGNGLSFSGTGHISLGQTYGNVQDGLTLSAWVKPTPAGSGYQGIVFHGGPNTDTFALFINYNLGVIAFKTQGTTTGGWVQVSNSTIWNGSWHHLAVTYNGSQKIIYLDGVPLTTVSATGNIDSGLGYNLLIGAGRDETPVPSEYLYQGLIDEVRVYNYALNSSQISSLYNIPQTTTYTLTINKIGTGTGNVTGAGTHNSGTVVTATATPNTGGTFTSWGGDCNSSGQVTMTSNKTCTATFTINTYNISSSSGSNGSISPLGTTAKTYGSNQTYTITPSTGYHIGSVLVDGVSQGSVSSYTFTNITSTHTISATFDIDVVSTSVISNVSAVSTSTSSFTANWITSDNSNSQVEYGLTTSYGNLTSLNTNLTTSHSVSIPNLKRNTTYHYRVKSVTPSSSVLQSSNQTIKTLSQLTRTPKVRSLSASSGSVRLSWLIPLDPDGNSYELYSGVIIMRSTTGFIQSVNTLTAIADIKNPTTTYHDTSIVNGTTYYYTFFAYDNLGVYSDPEFISFTPSQTVSSGGGGSSSSSGGGGSSSSSPTSNTSATTSVPTVLQPTASIITSVSPSYTFTTKMTIGAKNPDVKELQNILIEKGYLTGTADGSFGPKTLTAVKKFQTANNLVADGVIGQKGREVLNQMITVSSTSTPNSVPTASQPLVTPISTGAITLTKTVRFRSAVNDINEVKKLQQILINKGYLTGIADGVFGKQTLVAILSFQKANGLTSDGVAGANTRILLNK